MHRDGDVVCAGCLAQALGVGVVEVEAAHEADLDGVEAGGGEVGERRLRVVDDVEAGRSEAQTAHVA